MEAIVADINRTLKGWFAYFKHVHPSELEEIDRWMRVRLRSILRKRRGGRGRGRGQDHHRWPNRDFTGLGLFCLLDAKVTETTSLPQGANHRLESRMREIRKSGSEGWAGQINAPFLHLSTSSSNQVDSSSATKGGVASVTSAA